MGNIFFMDKKKKKQKFVIIKKKEEREMNISHKAILFYACLD